MGWCTEFITSAYFSKKTLDTRYKLENELEDNKAYLERLKMQLVTFAASDPKNLIQKDCEGNEFSLIESIDMLVENWLEQFKEAYADEIKYSDALDNFHKRWGDYVKPDLYGKFIGETDSVFTKDAVYEVNKDRDWNDDLKYYICIPGTEIVFINFKEDKFKKYFVETDEATYEAYRKAKYAAEVEAYRQKLENIQKDNEKAN